jgi:hypothetical protein
LEQNRCFRNENGIPERAAFRFFAADSCFICGDPHGVSERLSAASPKNFYFFVLRPAARFAENAFFGSAFFHKGRAFFFAPAAAVQRERFLRPAEKTMQLSALQYDSFHVSKFVIQTEKQDFF